MEGERLPLPPVPVCEPGDDSLPPICMYGCLINSPNLPQVALLTAPTASPAAPIQVLEGPSDVEFAAWHMRGNIIIAGSSDMTVWMWVALTGECVRVFAGKQPLSLCPAAL